jgi:hypothetical protein
MKSVYPIRLTTKIAKLTHLLGIHYLEIPKDVIQKMGGKFKVRLICKVNKTLSFQCGIISLGDGAGYISINIKRLKTFGLKEGDLADIELNLDESKFGIDVPEELAELFEQDPEGKERFDALKPGMQRYKIHYVASVKSSNLKIERAVKLITNF